MTPTTLDKLTPLARDLVSCFLSVHNATETVYVIESEHSLVTPPLGGDVKEFWFAGVAWNSLNEFGQGHWARLNMEFTPMAGSKVTLPTWRFLAYDSPRQWIYSTSKEDGCPMERCEWVEEFLRRYQIDEK